MFAGIERSSVAFHLLNSFFATKILDREAFEKGDVVSPSSSEGTFCI